MSKEQKKSMNMINEKHAYKKWLLEERACNKKYIRSPVQECGLNMCFILTTV